MEATHILLGRPWQFDRKVLHDGLPNKISFTFQGHKIILEMKGENEDQVKMKENRENEKKMRKMKKKSVKKSLVISSKEVKKVMLAHKAILRR